MIQSTSSSDRPYQPDAVSTAAARNGAVARPRPDRLSLTHRTQLHKALSQDPEIRPEMVERARSLANDPTYPSTDVLRQVSAQILASPDLSEEVA